MKQRYSKWLEKNVYDMNKKQEKYLESLDYEIEKPELIKYDDKIVRDIPHYIKIDKNAKTNRIQFDYHSGKFKVILKKYVYSIDEIDGLTNEINELKKIIENIEKL